MLVVSPTSGETASLYYSDREYTQLERLLAPADTGTRARPRKPPSPRAGRST